ncbi:iron ABC transporter permease [Candidatus Methylacidiphilum fumarolicum]|uniref:Transport system permease protein n=2 Tax=Candidatus Methylacidiphilum fumarolicum TaxID=591154 RepID=I0JVG6_METFB|nr:iron ABC transporter permease [Candidatus Methylacidiphilum fumarolicum]MBW6414862.1 iron ABC transporter permease [Candidatus Methylacidiphilum fumarolicum]TFE68302.1 ABC transporter permease [Candidatus Methylacidiphilum fumarolicum]TFE73529.1 iron ABC transporter permease [Candidatus Methylacidiphilum fumarolicum]TFE75010.1 iron ABC transporter permease [Candidatus Methylacidiphilum fumarolicum]TFE76555.1 ABC transporter permease [Candidatus Methylacidiphilum fumarolicum]
MRNRKRVHAFPWIAFLSVVLVLEGAFSLCLGRYPIPIHELIHSLWGKAAVADGSQQTIFEKVLWEIRFPRIVAAILVGSSLSISGASFQAIFSNPLASPALLGVLSGASFGGVLAMLVFAPGAVVGFCVFVGGLAAVLLSVAVARAIAGEGVLSLVLGGIVSNALFTSLLSLAKYVADPYNQLPGIVYWLMGGLSGVDRKIISLLWFPMTGAILGLVMLAPHLNALSLGEDEARSLGIHVWKSRLAVIGLSTLASSLTVVLAGTIGWIGLIVPHLLRFLVGADNERLVLASALGGAVFLLGIDDLSRTLFPMEVPLGILTELFGVLAFLLLLPRLRRWNGGE